MADDQSATHSSPDLVEEKHEAKKVYKKTTSKRRILKNMTNKETEVSSSNQKSNSSSTEVSPISERTVIGQEADLKPIKSAKVILKNVQEILNRSSSKKYDYSDEIRSEADGREDSSTQPDTEIEELSKLRCPSECTEAVVEREKRRRQRCADYPGLAFGSSVFGSDTLMKFSVIKNELHNIYKSQLKRAESEVAALNRRVQLLEEDLGRSEERIATATVKLAEASQATNEAELQRQISENCTLAKEVYLDTLESQLARFLADEVDNSKCDKIVHEFLLFGSKPYS